MGGEGVYTNYGVLGGYDFYINDSALGWSPLYIPGNTGHVIIGNPLAAWTSGAAYVGDLTDSTLQVHGSISMTGNLRCTNYAGQVTNVLYMATPYPGTSTHVYLDNLNGPTQSYDIYIRPGNGRYVVAGLDGTQGSPAMTALVPNGAGSPFVAGCTLGSSAFRWPTIFGNNADLSGTLQLTNGSNGVKFYDHYGTSLLTLSSVPVLVSTTYYSNLYLDHTGAYCASIYLRPANGQSVIIGMDGTQAAPAMSALIPNGTGSPFVAWATLGSATYRWPTIFGTVLDLNAVPGTPALSESGAVRLYADNNAKSLYGGTLTYTGALEYSFNAGLYVPLFALGGAGAGTFIGPAVNVGTGSVTAGDYIYWDGSAPWYGATDNVTVGGVTLVFYGGLYCGHHT